jgi:hypothetical protein
MCILREKRKWEKRKFETEHGVDKIEDIRLLQTHAPRFKGLAQRSS